MSNSTVNETTRRADAFLTANEARFISSATHLDKATVLLLGAGTFSEYLPKQFAREILDRDISWIADDQLFDVFISLSALHEYDSTLPDGDMLARVMQRLVSNEDTPGGPYKNETGKTGYTDNLAIAYFLNSIEVDLPNLRKYLLKRPDSAISNYFLIDTLRDAVLKKSSLNLQAMLIKNSSQSFSEVSSQEFIQSQSVDGSWRLNCSPNRFIDSFISTLFVRELLQNDVNETIKSPTAVYSEASSKAYKTLHNEFTMYSNPVKNSLYQVLKTVKNADTRGEISCLSIAFSDSLARLSVDIDTASFAKANICLWMAYTIYDDFLDNEGVAELLPVANIAMRRSLEIYGGVMSQKMYKRYVAKAFDTMDEANSIELKNFRVIVTKDRINLRRIPRYTSLNILSSRAAGHIVGPLLIAGSNNADDAQLSNLRSALNNYLIARQLNDDIHDWKEDLLAGRITYVVSRLLIGSEIKPKIYILADLIVQLEAYFWSIGFSEITSVISKHYRLSLEEFEHSSLLTSNPVFFEYIKHIQDSNLKSIERYKAQRAFLNQYKPPSAD